MTGLVQVFGSSPALPVFSQACLGFTSLLAVFSLSHCSSEWIFLPRTPNKPENPGASAHEASGGVCAFWNQVGRTDLLLLL